MTKRIDKIRARDANVHERWLREERNKDHKYTGEDAVLDRRTLLDLVDTQAAQIGEYKEYISRIEEVDKLWDENAKEKDKQIAAGVRIVEREKWLREREVAEFDIEHGNMNELETIEERIETLDAWLKEVSDE